MEMDDFITVMRAKRQLEMKQYRDKGYVIQDPKDYILLDKIELEYMGENTNTLFSLHRMRSIFISIKMAETFICLLQRYTSCSET